ncbi:hypothetical protein AXG93_2587s1580 [Marchantia polymorpha subsp. ruderalis]|uniref:Uncharacterized protein n=1 Tax=Marchantia polymorpha subsp. ruderalis TaxID=1480154 RepID=A0A176WSC1_MARPO|nr:hypothetical protein AXG93_2587s1580 [Marchantia polymorpha subsp. ruderalis]
MSSSVLSAGEQASGGRIGDAQVGIVDIGILVNTYDQLRKLFNYDLLTPNVVTYCAKGTRPEVEQVTKYCDSIPFA